MSTISSSSGADEKRYVFISYAHKDTKRVTELLSLMTEAGISLWYDQGIDPGSEWDDNIAMHIEKCGCMVAVISHNYLASDNCKDELKFARDRKKDILIIYIDECELPSGIALRLNRSQAIFMYKYASKKAFFQTLIGAKILAPYITGQHTLVAPVTEQEEQPDALPDIREVVPENQVQLGYLTASPDIPLGLGREHLMGRTLIALPGPEEESSFLKHLLMNLYQSGISFVIISTNHRRYRDLMRLIPNMQVFTPGRPDISPFPFNPFYREGPYKRTNISQLIPRICHCFQLAFSLSPKAGTLFIQAVRTCATHYRILDDFDRTQTSGIAFTLREVAYYYKKHLEEGSFTAEEKETLLSECESSIQGALEDNEDVLDRMNHVENKDLLNTPTLIDLQGVYTPQNRSLLALLLTEFLYMERMQQDLSPQTPEMQQVLVLDDISVLTDNPQAEEESQNLSRIVSAMHLLRELQYANIGVIGVTAAPEKISRRIISNTAARILITGPSSPARGLAEYMMVQPHDRQHIPPNSALLMTKDRLQPVFFLPDKTEELNEPLSDDDVRVRDYYWLGKENMLRRYSECTSCIGCENRCDPVLQGKADLIAARLYFRDFRKINTPEQLHAYLSDLSPAIAPEMLETAPEDYFRQYSCLRIRTAKEFMSKKGLLCPVDKALLQSPNMEEMYSHTEKIRLDHIPVGIDKNGKIVFWNAAGQAYTAVIYDADSYGLSGQTQKHLQNLIGMICRAAKQPVTLMDDSNLLHPGNQVPQPILPSDTEYNERLKLHVMHQGQRYQHYKKTQNETPPDWTEEVCIVHLTPSMTNAVSDQLRTIKGVARRNLGPICVYIIFLISSSFRFSLNNPSYSFDPKEFLGSLPTSNMIKLGTNNFEYAKIRKLKPFEVQGCLQGKDENDITYCRFI